MEIKAHITSTESPADMRVTNETFSCVVIRGFRYYRRKTATSDFKGSGVRIYCDNDSAGKGKRWVPAPDLAGSAKKSKNSKKPFELLTWWDSGNQIFRKIGAMGCQDLDVVTLGQTYKFKYPRYTDSDQNPNRESVTLCHLTKVANVSPGDGDEPYGWEEILDVNADEALDTADSYGTLVSTKTS
ncbi:hypothetical protein NHQ30_005438 [Ciborinia camelliae]|nr:hypothetical protein NHQ30_005438 [Ciborinia camelliae]